MPMASTQDEMVRQREGAEQLLCDVANFVVFNQIPGDYLEFGIYRGETLARTFALLCSHWEDYREIERVQGVPIAYDERYLDSKRFIAFDSFQGLPKSSAHDRPLHFVQGVYKASTAEVRQAATTVGLTEDRLLLVEGWFADTLTRATKQRLNLQTAAIVFIDCDLYESAVEVFHFISNLITDGSVIIVDDYFRYKGHPRRGMRRALSDWLAANPEIAVTELTRCSANRVAFICHRET